MQSDDKFIETIAALREKAFELGKTCGELIQNLHTYTDSEEKRVVIKKITEMTIEANLLNDDADKMIAEMKDK